MSILILDIETAPALSYHWGMYDQTIGTNQVREDWYMLSYAAKWLDSRNIIFDAIWKYPKYFRQKPRSDLKIAESLWDLLDQAKIVIAHNGDAFDVKKINTSFLKNNLQPCNSYLTIDTKKESKKNFGFMSNKLDHIMRRLGLGHKLSHEGFDMWLGAMRGDKKWCAKMERYNKQDVRGLESVYKAMRPFMKNHPDINALEGDKTRLDCPNCGSRDTIGRGWQYTKLSRYPRRGCNSCGARWKARG